MLLNRPHSRCSFDIRFERASARKLSFAKGEFVSELDDLQEQAEVYEDAENKIKGKRTLQGTAGLIATIVAVGGVVYQFINAGFGMQSEIQLRSMHWAYMAFLAFLLYPASDKSSHKKPSVYDWVFACVAFIVSAYVFFTWQEVAERLGYAIPRDIVFGIITIVLIFELVRRVVGIPLVILAALFIFFAFFGKYMPNIIAHKGTTLNGLIRVLYISTDGIFGVPIGISASYVILFIVFGSFLQESGGGKLFTDVAFGLVGRSTGGPAKASIVSSCLMGMISGAAVANVVTTGTFTIPLMKKTGYDGVTAAGIEAVSSSGGQIMPPVMGAAAFMIAEMCNISYGTVAICALPMAIIYYVYLYFSVHVAAKKSGLEGLNASMLPSVKKAILERGHLLIPLAVMIFLIAIGRSPGKSIFWSTVLVVVVSGLKKNTRMGLKEVITAMRNGAYNAIPVAVACAAAGIITGVISLTGIGLRFSSILISFSQGQLLPMLLLTMVAAIILGMGLPTSACYAILAVLTAPALIRIGVPPLAAHYFIFFFGCISTITPPVALSAYAAAGIAQADPMKAGWVAFKLGLIGFIIPYLGVYKPALLLMDSVFNCIIYIAMSMLAVVTLSYVVQGYRNYKLNMFQRLLFLIPTAVIFLDTPLVVDLMGVGLCCIAFYLTRKKPVKAVA